MSSHSIIAGLLGLGGPEILLIFGGILLLFGGAKLPGLARGLGQSIREFKKAAGHDEPLAAEPSKLPSSLSATSSTPASTPSDLADTTRGK